MGKTEEGRDMVVLADRRRARHWRSSTRYKADAQGADRPAHAPPRPAPSRSSAPRKPIYWLTSGMHSPETRRPRDADGAGVPAGGGGDAVHPARSATTSSPSSRR
ncbi:MAG: hypothetical protein V9E87_12665 [Gemmatimonadales bacterium]